MTGVTVALSREVIVEAGLRRLDEGGPEELSLRAVARDLGVTAPALYAYVADREDLLAAIATSHFETLVARFETIDATDPLDQVRAVSRMYIDHALASPALFRLMFRYPFRQATGRDAFPPSTRAFEVAQAATAAAAAAGQIEVDDVDLAAMTMWIAVHGVAEVLLMGFDFDPATVETLVTSVIETVLTGQGARPG